MSALALLTRGYICPTSRIALELPLPVPAAQDILVRSLELPLPTSNTIIQGIHASDIIIRSAIVAAIADLRANPWLLDYIFASIPQDALTWKDYGQKSVDEAKNWFLKTNIRVAMEPVMNELVLPVISIQLAESSEVTPEAILGDIHGDPKEGNSSKWPALTRPFTPIGYDPVSGTITLSEEIIGLGIGPGMFIVDGVGRAHEILEVHDEVTFSVAPNTVADFRNSVLKPHRPSFITDIESSSFKETYRIGVHVQNEPQYLTWLHSIVVFCLLRYKQALLEARGFERSTFQSSDFGREQQFETEIVFSRHITLTGHVRQYWPKIVAPVIDVVDGGTPLDNAWVRVDGTRIADSGVEPKTQLWVGSLDDDE